MIAPVRVFVRPVVTPVPEFEPPRPMKGRLPVGSSPTESQQRRIEDADARSNTFVGTGRSDGRRTGAGRRPGPGSGRHHRNGRRRDPGGVAAALPGVVVEARSPALIERFRSAFTDGAGNYRFIALPPGTYSVTFTLPGFRTVVREGIVLTGAFLPPVDAAMTVGQVQETVTVTGAAPWSTW